MGSVHPKISISHTKKLLLGFFHERNNNNLHYFWREMKKIKSMPLKNGTGSL